MDTITGSGAGGRLRGGEDDDVLAGGAGEQRVEGGAGGDYLAGGEGDDALAGGTGGDLLDGGYGDDASDAGAGDDFVWLFEGEDRVTLGEGADTLGIELSEGAPEDRYGIGATVVADFDPAEDQIGASASGVDAAGRRVEVDLFADFLDSDGDGALSAADREVLGTGGGIVLDLGAALARALGREDIAPRTQTVELVGVEALDLETNVAPLGEAYGGFAASHEDLLAAAADAGLTGIA
jgi:Ca2+-binding RTX toxin-like protein